MGALDEHDDFEAERADHARENPGKPLPDNLRFAREVEDVVLSPSEARRNMTQTGDHDGDWRGK